MGLPSATSQFSRSANASASGGVKDRVMSSVMGHLLFCKLYGGCRGRGISKNLIYGQPLLHDFAAKLGEGHAAAGRHPLPPCLHQLFLYGLLQANLLSFFCHALIIHIVATDVNIAN